METTLLKKDRTKSKCLTKRCQIIFISGLVLVALFLIAIVVYMQYFEQENDSSHCLNDHEYHQVILKLQCYVEDNEEFAMQLDDVYTEANFNVTYHDMYNFFNLWLTKAPNASNEMGPSATILAFTGTTTGNELIQNPLSAQWFLEWLNVWEIYLNSINSTSVIYSYYPLINMTEYIIPSNGYKSFNEFFYRKINLEYRPISSPLNKSIITSPCDGEVTSIIHDTIDIKNTILNIKNEQYNISKILRNREKAKLFQNATIIQITIWFHDYHRYHSPINGTIIDIEQLAGFYYYNPINMTMDKKMNQRTEYNRRGIVYINNTFCGISAFIAVGLGHVSSVNMHQNLVGKNIDKGQELGYFANGGSTILLIFQQNVINHFTVNKNQYLKMGQQIAVTNVECNS